MRTDYTYETTRSALMRLGIGHVHELAIEEDRQREASPLIREDPGGPTDYAEADEWWERHGWDLLLDYDRPQDVPGALYGEPFFSMEPDGGRGPGLHETHAIRFHEGPPQWGVVRAILEARLKRAGYTIVRWEVLNSTNGWHVKVRLNPEPTKPIEAVALQAICGSDPLRESCNIQRASVVQRWLVDADRTEPKAADFWRKRWNVLYEANPERMKV